MSGIGGTGHRQEPISCWQCRPGSSHVSSLHHWDHCGLEEIEIGDLDESRRYTTCGEVASEEEPASGRGSAWQGSSRKGRHHNNRTMVQSSPQKRHGVGRMLDGLDDLCRLAGIRPHTEEVSIVPSTGRVRVGNHMKEGTEPCNGFGHGAEQLDRL